MFAVCIKHGNRKLIMIIFPFDRIFAQVFQKIFCPSATPFIIESCMIIFHTVCQLRPETIFLRDQKQSRISLFDHGIQMFQKFQSIQILIGSIHIWCPLSRISAIIQIKHRIHIIHAKSVCMINLSPETCIGNEEIFYHRADIIIK